MRAGHVDAVFRTHVAGWAADSDQPDCALSLCVSVDGQQVGQSLADRPRRDITALGRFGSTGHGFHFEFDPPLTADADHTVHVRYADTMEVLPSVERVMAQDADAPVPQDSGQTAAPLTPILISAPGRSGTTYLMRCLAAAPQIVAATLVPYEVRLLAYYATAFTVLTARGDLARSTHPDRLEGDGFHVGFNPFTAPQYDAAFRSREAMRSFQEGWLPERLATALSDTVLEYYRRLAIDQGKTAATLFAEKNNNLNEPTRRFLRRAFPARREIAIVRDPRDVLCSHVAYFASSQEKAFAHLSHSCRQLITLAEAGGEVCLIRYEDMISGDRATFDRLSAYLGASVEPDRTPAEAAIFRTHGTSRTPAQSIGRWRRDLSQGLRAQTSDAWKTFLQRFGYEA